MRIGSRMNMNKGYTKKILCPKAAIMAQNTANYRDISAILTDRTDTARRILQFAELRDPHDAGRGASIRG